MMRGLSKLGKYSGPERPYGGSDGEFGGDLRFLMGCSLSKPGYTEKLLAYIILRSRLFNVNRGMGAPALRAGAPSQRRQPPTGAGAASNVPLL